MSNLQLGWCQGYMALKYHMEEALIEKRRNPGIANPCPPIAIFSQSYYNQFNILSNEKIYDYSFIGSIKSDPQNREWAIDFARKHFTNNSIFVNTDNDPNWQSLGSFDYSFQHLGFNPKETIHHQSRGTQYRNVRENLFYFETMANSRFVLCPAGDTEWSFRFYETLICKSIPVVVSWHHTYRTAEESRIPYRYFLSSDLDRMNNIGEEEYQAMVNENDRLFREYHMLK